MHVLSIIYLYNSHLAVYLVLDGVHLHLLTTRHIDKSAAVIALRHTDLALARSHRYNVIIRDCCSYFKFSLPSEIVRKEERKIPKEFHATYWYVTIFLHQDIVC